MKTNTPRYLKQHIIKDLDKKIVLLGGPRQVGKTTLSRSLMDGTYYLNYDVPSDRKTIKDQTWPRDSTLLVLDELHKLPKWKSYLKGIADDEQGRPRILVTGSAKLDTIKKVGDSLAGRYLYWKLHPLCIKELKSTVKPEVALEKILNQSGFPEPHPQKEGYRAGRNDGRFAANADRRHRDAGSEQLGNQPGTDWRSGRCAVGAG